MRPWAGVGIVFFLTNVQQDDLDRSQVRHGCFVLQEQAGVLRGTTSSRRVGAEKTSQSLLQSQMPGSSQQLLCRAAGASLRRRERQKGRAGGPARR